MRDGAKRKQENRVQMGERVAGTQYLEEAGRGDILSAQWQLVA